MAETPKALNKTTKSLFDIQHDNAMKASKYVKSVNFVLRKGNHIEYINIPVDIQICITAIEGLHPINISKKCSIF